MSNECGTISKEHVFNLIENNNEIHNKLEELGITQEGDQLKIDLRYSELLTAEEQLILHKNYKKMFSKKTRKRLKEMGMNVKFGNSKRELRFCPTDGVCDYCYLSLQKRR